MPERLTIRRPDDWHLHLRDGEVLRAVTPFTAAHFGRAIIMPNLVPPVVTGADAAAYRARVLASVPPGADFEPLMTLYLTETTDPDDVARSAAERLIHAVKLYPAGATTNSDAGVRNIEAVAPVLERMAEIGLPLLIHGEVTRQEVDVFDREAVFIEEVLEPLRRRVPTLRVVLEHITTADAVDYVRSAQDAGLAATITPHHVVLNRNSLFAGGLRPHRYCLPIAKREHHRQAVRAAATSGDPRFFLGTDSAPHIDAAKESDCGCAGIFNVVNALGCLAEVFESDGALHHLEAFVSCNGPSFYGLDPSSRTTELVRTDEPVIYRSKVETGEGTITVFEPDFDIHWKVVEG